MVTVPAVIEKTQSKASVIVHALDYASDVPAFIGMVKGRIKSIESGKISPNEHDVAALVAYVQIRQGERSLEGEAHYQSTVHAKERSRKRLLDMGSGLAHVGRRIFMGDNPRDDRSMRLIRRYLAVLMKPETIAMAADKLSELQSKHVLTATEAHILNREIQNHTSILLKQWLSPKNLPEEFPYFMDQMLKASGGVPVNDRIPLSNADIILDRVVNGSCGENVKNIYDANSLLCPQGAIQKRFYERYILPNIVPMLQSKGEWKIDFRYLTEYALNRLTQSHLPVDTFILYALEKLQARALKNGEREYIPEAQAILSNCFSQKSSYNGDT